MEVLAIRSPARRLVALLTLLTLLIGVVGLTASEAFAGGSGGITSTRVRGIDVDRTTIPGLESAMNRDKLTSVDLVRFYVSRIKQLNPRLRASITVHPFDADGRSVARPSLPRGEPTPG